jgi:hypothetical protein
MILCKKLEMEREKNELGWTEVWRLEMRGLHMGVLLFIL